jgi:hypothetical protein
VSDNLKSNRNRFALMTVCGLAVYGVALSSMAQAQDSTGSIAAPERVASARPAPRHAASTAGNGGGGGQYFVEFRSRYAKSYGHTFLVHGRVGQRITAKDVAGLHPTGEDPTNWVIGHFVPVPSETGASDGDTEEKYVSARYRITMNKAQYDRVVAYIRMKQASSPTWSAELYNCNAFVADIAQFMGLKTPKSTLIYPKVFITNLRQINTHPNSPDTLVSDNMKEMQSPTRDGQAMELSGIHVVHESRPVTRRATVTIGNIREASHNERSADAR